MAEPIPQPLRQYILDHIGSVAQLEALLLLRRQAGRAATASDIGRALYIPDSAAAMLLGTLRAEGLVSVEGSGYRYEPVSEELRTMVDLLAETYARALIPVTNLIHQNSSGLRHFADAFKLRKDK